MIAIAQLGGYLNRKCDKHPGFQSLWKGYTRFRDMVAILMFKKASEARRR